jgi:predicted ATPase
LETRRIVITGGPGSGKTTLIAHLESMGYQCLHEISRDVIQQAQQQGIEQLFLTNPILFSEKLLDGRLEQYHEAGSFSEPVLFYDRGLPDVTAYMDYVGTHYPEHFSKICTAHRYDEVFLLPPWPEIYTQDNERYESFEQAQKIHSFLRDGYSKYGYDVQELPIGTVTERVSHLLSTIAAAP